MLWLNPTPFWSTCTSACDHTKIRPWPHPLQLHHALVWSSGVASPLPAVGAAPNLRIFRSGTSLCRIHSIAHLSGPTLASVAAISPVCNRNFLILLQASFTRILRGVLIEVWLNARDWKFQLLSDCALVSSLSE